MATPTTFSAEMLAQMMKEFTPEPRSTFLLSRGYREKVEAEFPLRPEMDRNPIYDGGLSQPYLSMNVRVMDIPKKKVFDWSGCRSPSRAQRRYARGIPQRVRITEHDVAYMFDERILSDIMGRYDRMCGKLLFGA